MVWTNTKDPSGDISNRSRQKTRPTRGDKVQGLVTELVLNTWVKSRAIGWMWGGDRGKGTGGPWTGDRGRDGVREKVSGTCVR